MATSSPVRHVRHVRQVRQSSRLLLLGALLALLTATEAKPAAPTPMVAFPAAASLSWPAVRARAAPAWSARPLAVVTEFRRDFYPTVVHLIQGRRDAKGLLWYRIRLVGRPNGRTGWVPATALENVRHLRERIKIDRSSRWLYLYRDGRLLLKTRVGVGKAGAETPLGHFFVSHKFRPQLYVLGVYALETSAYSRLSDWPGGGVVGLHGTYQPSLLGGAVSHGCVRMSNEAVSRLRVLVPLGTPIDVVD